MTFANIPWLYSYYLPYYRYPEAANALKEQIEQFELVRADWEMEKEALEEVVVRMREQLKEKDRELQSLTAERVSIGFNIQKAALSIFITHDVIIHCYSLRNKSVHYI